MTTEPKAGPGPEDFDPLSRPHDSYFKEILSSLERARSVLESSLPADVSRLIDFGTLQRDPGDWVVQRLTERFSDALFSARLKPSASGGPTRPARIGMLVEHKSGPEECVGVQAMSYMAAAWHDHRKQRLPPPLTVFIPLVLYHGETVWRTPRGFAELFKPYDPALERYVPQWMYEVVDLSPAAGREITGPPQVRAGLSLLRHIRDPRLGDLLDGILRLLPESTAADQAFVLQTLTYLSASPTLTYDQLQASTRRVFESPLVESGMPSIAETFIQKGMEEGIEKGQQDLVLRQLERRTRAPVSAVNAEAVRGLSAERLNRLATDLLDMTSPADLDAWLQANRG